ncbi:MAG: protein-L-isoaspartate(D-aspartate) O-methyltransferase [Phycisphaerae bacterium]|nr:protein-L-isoaspartate(D-aspartate) O-methyltransferase [Phycisphaerae bacterium]MCZ2399592.1 protein-L-isoaspartate(D-aspartate) O-methyltransferase [Phycisphaerae bacterium]NUQ50253.1 protein-L-isoaspartate(D-aspartate) O-methyltransferase [Phycisphaerae bacterium]
MPHIDAHRPQRDDMIGSQLVARGVRTEAVLDAFRRVPRELFIPPELADRAYEDGALPVDCGQTISQPYIVARMTELLELTPSDRVLEVGTGTGYQTAILANLAAEVFTIEWHLKLMTAAVRRLRQLELANVTFRCGDGSLGWPEQAPFDAIIVTAGGPRVPESLRQQMSLGGRLVMPIGPKDDQVLVRVRRAGESDWRQEQVLACRFVKLMGAEGWSE